MEWWQAAVLGAVEGLTEFLPISSTGHLILAAHALRLHGAAVKTFEVVIQAGALAAVIGLYRAQMASMWQGLWGRDARGRRLLMLLVVSFLPSAIVGVLLHGVIKAKLFGVWPVVGALAAGGVAMIVMDRWLARGPQPSGKMLQGVTFPEALVIGCAQCLALWPGTSRSMVTILAGLALGWPATMAAEYSFLLALPTLGAATVFDFAAGGHRLFQHVGWGSVVCGYATAGVVAALAIRAFVRYLTQRGLEPFGWYRVVLAAALCAIAALS